jgi:hypothetical protein
MGIDIKKVKEDFKKLYTEQLLRSQNPAIINYWDGSFPEFWEFIEHHLQEERKKTIDEVLEEVGKAKNRTIDKSHQEKDQREKSLIRASANGLQGAVNILNLFKQK